MKNFLYFHLISSPLPLQDGLLPLLKVTGAYVLSYSSAEHFLQKVLTSPPLCRKFCASLSHPDKDFTDEMVVAQLRVLLTLPITRLRQYETMASHLKESMVEMKYAESCESFKEMCVILECIEGERKGVEERMSEGKREFCLQGLYERLIGLENFPAFQLSVEKRQFVTEG